jgi:hypothetical protein
MTRYAIDARTALRIIREGVEVPTAHSLVGPSLLRSHVLGLVYDELRDGAITPSEAKTLLDGLATLRIRLLGDRVSRSVALTLAAEHEWPDTADAEYLAVATLQADALVAVDDELRRKAEGLVELAPFDALSGPTTA